MNALQRAIYNVLNRAPITTTLGAKVYDDIPEATTLPVLRIDVIPGEPWDTFGRAGHQHLVEIHVFTQYAGTLKLASLIDAIVDALDGGALAVTGQRVWDVQRMSQRAGDEEIVGGVKTLHRIAPFRVLMSEAP
jgi:hypothetical protein